MLGLGESETDLYSLITTEQLETVLRANGMSQQQIERRKKAFHKEYRGLPGGYPTPDDLSKMFLATSILQLEAMKTANSVDIAIFAIVNSLLVESALNPYYWLDLDLARDLDFSDPPEELERIVLPEAGTILLPDNFLRTSTGIVKFLAYRIFKPDIGLGFEGSDRLNLIGFKGDGCKLCFWGAEGSMVNVAGIVRLVESEFGWQVIRGKNFVLGEPVKSEKDSNRVLALLLNILSYATYVEPIFSEATADRRIWDKKKKCKYSLPLWIGKNYRSQVYRKSEATSDRSSDAPLRTISPHRRRGHWRSVAHGKGRSERRLQFIQPTLVGFKSRE